MELFGRGERMKQYSFYVRDPDARMGAYVFTVFSESVEQAKLHAFNFSKTRPGESYKIELSRVAGIEEGKNSYFYDEWL